MPLRLIPPDPRHPTWRVRGVHLRVRVDRSTGTRDKALAGKILKKWQDDIERGSFTRPDDPTFAGATLAYLNAGGNPRFLPEIIGHFKHATLASIDQQAVDGAAQALHPDGTAATRNRQVYTPIIAVLRYAGVEKPFKRPKGARGESRLSWLNPDDFNALVAGARSRPRFAALLVWLTYTGCRLSEALRVRPKDVEVDRAFAFCGKTKNGDPRPLHLPARLVQELGAFEWGTTRVFGVSDKCGRLYTWLSEAEAASGVTIPEGVAFHIFRHTFGAWARRYGGLDTSGLVATGAWKSHDAARVYEHVDVTEAMKVADMFPVEKSVEKSKKDSNIN